ncbi:MAG: hypothetical protein JWO87_3698, partial [Phycisphaerales bacterium]|nr:hypothetical protein [Phycisphaerales bacterium]
MPRKKFSAILLSGLSLSALFLSTTVGAPAEPVPHG